MHNTETFTRQTQGKLSIRKMVTLITARGINSNKHFIDEYVIMDVHLKNIKNGKPIIIVLRRKMHLIKDLKANFLIGKDILSPKKVKIDLENSETCIKNCEITISLGITNGSTSIHKTIYFKKSMIISPHTVVFVPIYNLSVIPSDCKYVFEPDEINFSFYVHIIISDTRAVLARNDEDRPILSRY